jgi:hypothetical protein
MATPNRSLIEKADLAISNLQSDGGYLENEQADRFIRLAIKESVLLSKITVTPMKNPISERSKIRFAGRVLQPGNSAQALALAQRSKPDLSTYTLTAQLFKAEVRIDDETMEDQIEREVFADTVLESLAAAVSRDVEWIAIQGDTASATATLAVLDGFVKQATTNQVNASSANLTKTILKDMLKTLPTEFAKIPTLEYFTVADAQTDFIDSMGDRATMLGDNSILRDGVPYYRSMPINAVPEWNDTGSATGVLQTNPKNMVVGFHRKIRFERDRDVSAGVNIIVASLRFDAKFQEETAVSEAINVATT